MGPHCRYRCESRGGELVESQLNPLGVGTTAPPSTTLTSRHVKSGEPPTHFTAKTWHIYCVPTFTEYNVRTFSVPTIQSTKYGGYCSPDPMWLLKPFVQIEEQRSNGERYLHTPVPGVHTHSHQPTSQACPADVDPRPSPSSSLVFWRSVGLELCGMSSPSPLASFDAMGRHLPISYAWLTLTGEWCSCVLGWLAQMGYWLAPWESGLPCTFCCEYRLDTNETKESTALPLWSLDGSSHLASQSRTLPFCHLRSHKKGALLACFPKDYLARGKSPQVEGSGGDHSPSWASRACIVALLPQLRGLPDVTAELVMSRRKEATHIDNGVPTSFYLLDTADPTPRSNQPPLLSLPPPAYQASYLGRYLALLTSYDHLGSVIFDVDEIRIFQAARRARPVSNMCDVICHPGFVSGPWGSGLGIPGSTAMSKGLGPYGVQSATSWHRWGTIELTAGAAQTSPSYPTSDPAATSSGFIKPHRPTERARLHPDPQSSLPAR
ncbi:uncharacterized protein CLUP02_05944 [Colletotrichum lupini]|uniref:Uncharacterized protein n=1 Tax=Colletotrichum lupini TaxID=145971 RepID=A0A9Q8SN66_9PEZI|nr:uncharacterized protein CLUP02_05944 [Colletotrichum lupini]UQC80461.1 hypothetical protein CLUP02_05944 [Colletotrichum lupini]